VTPIQFALFDDRTNVGEVKHARSVPAIGEGITLEPVKTGERPRRFRVHDVDRGYVQTGPGSPIYRDSTVIVYLIDADDPRRDLVDGDNPPRKGRP
jgi:hypothetical protein